MHDVYLWIFVVLSVGLLFVNVYQYLIQRSALRIAEILYIMSRTVRERAADVRKSQKDVEIIEAHLFDLTTSARSLLRALGRSESSLGPDPEHTMSPNGHHMDSDSLIRLADNISTPCEKSRRRPPGRNSATPPSNAFRRRCRVWSGRGQRRSSTPWPCSSASARPNRTSRLRSTGEVGGPTARRFQDD